jgi:predicted transcriptional regulator of viral defense system
VDRVVTDLAARQHGVVGRQQLEAAGLSPRMLRTRAGDGRLLVLHRGVYAVGHAQLRPEGRWLAAVLACGPGALLSHRSAAALHGLRPANASRIEVSTVWHRASSPGIRVHGRRRLAPEDGAVVRGVPVTTVERTLVDLAEVLRPEQLLQALGAAEEARSADVHAIERALARVRGRPGRGHAAMRAALDEMRARGGDRTRSDMEELFLALVARAGLPRPRTNVWFPAPDGGGVEVDAVWRSERVAVELDSWRHHRGRDAFQRDRTKGNALTLEGWTVLRFTWADVRTRPAHVAATVTRALAPP